METETASVMIRVIAQKVAIKQASDEESYSVPHQYAAGVTRTVHGLRWRARSD